jgi:hypothetical protein
VNHPKILSNAGQLPVEEWLIRLFNPSRHSVTKFVWFVIYPPAFSVHDFHAATYCVSSLLISGYSINSALIIHTIWPSAIR